MKPFSKKLVMISRILSADHCILITRDDNFHYVCLNKKPCTMIDQLYLRLRKYVPEWHRRYVAGKPIQGEEEGEPKTKLCQDQ